MDKKKKWIYIFIAVLSAIMVGMAITSFFCTVLCVFVDQMIQIKRKEKAKCPTVTRLLYVIKKAVWEKPQPPST